MAPTPGMPAVYDRRWTVGPLTPAQQWEVAVGAILTQNTAWKNAELALGNLKKAVGMELDFLSRVSRVRLERWVRPSGFFRQKAARLQGLARYMRARWSGRPDRWGAQPPTLARSELLALSGIGPETADSILLYAAGRPVFVVDAYTRRLAHRLRLFRYNTYDMIQKFFHHALPRRAALYKETHALIVAHAKAHCRAVPRCDGCPLRRECPHGTPL